MATITPVDIGAAPDDGTGDPLRTAFNKINGNEANLNTDKLEAPVTFAQIQDVATSIMAGRVAGGSGSLQELSVAQVKTLLAYIAGDITFTPTGDIAATDVQAAIAEVDAEKSAITRTINAQTGVAFTPALTDEGDVITMDNAAANTLTIPTNAAVAFPVGTQLDVAQLGAGTTTVSADIGVNLNDVSAGKGDLSAQYASVTLLKLATDSWLMTGNHTAVA